PWELMAKTDREKFADQGLDTLRDYCNDFLDFIQKPIFLTESAQEHDVLQLAIYLFSRFTGDEVNGGATKRNRAMRENMERFIARPNKRPLGNFAHDCSVHKFRRQRGGLCKAVCDEGVCGFNVSTPNQTLFTQCVYDLIVHHIQSDYHSGFALFGYGAQ